MMSRKQLAEMMDHSLLRPTLTLDDIRRGCKETIQYGMAAVLVNPVHVNLASKLLGDSAVKVCGAISFPFGLSTTDVKVYETRTALAQGAREIDLVMNFCALRSGDTEFVLNDVASVVREAKQSSGDVIVKVILENCYLTDAQKTEACHLAVKAGADFVKTSTGYGAGGATVEDVRLMKKTVGPKIGVKAAGGIRTLDQALAMIEAGANRIGTSASISILESLRG